MASTTKGGGRMTDRQTTLDEFTTSKTRQTRLTEFGIVLLFLSASFAGCTELIPDPPSDWNLKEGTFSTYDNKTIPNIVIGNNTTLLQVSSLQFNVTTDDNTTFLVRGHLYQADNSTFTFTDGYAPNIGKVYAHFFYIENATYKYKIYYIEWKV